MTYLLTEIALEMLGYKFYDDEGEPHSMDLDASKLARIEGALNLQDSVGIKFQDRKSPVIDKSERKLLDGKVEKTAEVEEVLPTTNAYAAKLPLSSIQTAETQKPSNSKANTAMKITLEREMARLAADLKREKTIFYRELGHDVKSNLNNILEAVGAYSKQEFEKLLNELKNLNNLRENAEHLSSVKYPKKYFKYLKHTQALSSKELLQSAMLAPPSTSLAASTIKENCNLPK